MPLAPGEEVLLLELCYKVEAEVNFGRRDTVSPSGSSPI